MAGKGSIDNKQTKKTWIRHVQVMNEYVPVTDIYILLYTNPNMEYAITHVYLSYMYKARSEMERKRFRGTKRTK